MLHSHFRQVQLFLEQSPQLHLVQLQLVHLHLFIIFTFYGSLRRPVNIEKDTFFYVNFFYVSENVVTIGNGGLSSNCMLWLFLSFSIDCLFQKNISLLICTSYVCSHNCITFSYVKVARHREDKTKSFKILAGLL